MLKIFTSTILLILQFSLSYSQWHYIGTHEMTQVKCMEFYENKLICSIWFPVVSLFSSTNSGANWNTFGLNGVPINTLLAKGNLLFAGSTSGLYRMTNSDTNWIRTPLDHNINSVLNYNNNLFAASGSYGVYRSSNNGLNWEPTGLINRLIFSMESDSSYIYAGSSNGIFKSSNNGINWVQTGLNNLSVYSIESVNNYLFAGTGNGIYRSLNYGENWTLTDLNTGSWSALKSFGNILFAGTQFNKIYISSDYGNVWLNKSEGLDTISIFGYVKCFIKINDDIFAGLSSGLCKRSISNIIGLSTVSNTIPLFFSIDQNYPNPFNPVTNIRFNIPVSGEVKIEVFDQLGSLISVPVNEHLGPGVYETKWNAGNNSSGIYFYRLTSGKFTGTKKMILLK